MVLNLLWIQSNSIIINCNQDLMNSNSKEQPKKKLGPCCVCKETKQLRDSCLFTKNEEECSEFIYRHNECLREHGFEPVK